MPALRRHMQRGDALAMRESAEGAFAIDGRTVVDQPCGRFHAIANRGPDEWSPSIRVGIETRPSPQEPGEHLRSAALAGPDQRLVQNLLRIRGRLPIREPAVRPVKYPRRTSLGGKRFLSAKAPFHQVRSAQPGGST